MSFTLNNNLTALYTGKTANDWYSAAFLSSVTVNELQLLSNVKSSIKLNRMDVANIVQAADCDFSASGSLTLSHNTLSVCDFKVNAELCIKDFEATFISEQMRAGANNSDLPGDFMTYLMGQMAGNVGQWIEQKLWTGDTDASPNPDECDGIIKKLSADSAVVDVAAVGGGLSASNIVAELQKVYNAIPATVVKTDPRLRIFMGTAAYGYYLQARAAVATGSGDYFTNGYVNLNFLGIRVILAPGMPANKMVAATSDNIAIGTDLVDDFSQINVIDMRQTTGAPNLRFVGNFKLGVQHKVGSEIVLYA